MSINRIQFQPWLSLADFLKDYGTDAQCEVFLEQSRWPPGFVCPDCGQLAPFSLGWVGPNFSSVALAGSRCP